MKGVIFNVVEDIITEHFGADPWDDRLERADVDGAYTSLGNYDDQELMNLVGAAGELLELTTEDVPRFIGSHGFVLLAGRYPRFLEGHASSRTLLADLNGVIHPQVLNLYPGATVPEFDFRVVGSHVELVYSSARGLCHLAEGLADGVVRHFAEMATISQPHCRHRGDETCLITIDYRDG